MYIKESCQKVFLVRVVCVFFFFSAFVVFFFSLPLKIAYIQKEGDFSVNLSPHPIIQEGKSWN